jgi:hypothetical protein
MNNRFIRILYFLFTALIIIAPAIYCRYPLVFSDSGTYLSSSFSLTPPVDRPIGYGLFIWTIRLITFQNSLWYVVFFQGLLSSYLIYKVLSILFPDSGGKNYYRHFVIVMCLMLLSSLGWYASQLMPDIFCSVLILTIFIFMQNEVKGIKLFFFALLLFCFNITHFSHLLIFLIIIFILLAYGIVKYQKNITRDFLKRIMYLILIWILSVQGIMLCNYYRGNYGYVLNPSSNVYFTGKLCETGILKEYLDDNCSKINLPLCAYKDSLPKSENDFVWDSKSPFTKLNSWTEGNKEYAPIVKGVLTSPKYLSLFAWESIKGMIIQFFQIDNGSGLHPYGKKWNIYNIIKNGLDTEQFNEYINDEQNSGELNFGLFNKFNYLVLGASALILFFSINENLIGKNVRVFVNMVIIGVVVNAFVTGSLSCPDSRYQARVTWLLVFAALCCLIEVLPRIIKTTFKI